MPLWLRLQPAGGGILQEALKLLGFGTPFVYAAAIYGLFHYLDEKASDAAKTAIAVWLKQLNYDKRAPTAAIVEVFDRLYTKPLLSWRAFLRSALFTLVVTSFFILEFLIFSANRGQLGLKDDATILGMVLVFGLVGNLISDYVSLFVIRKWLTIGGKSPLLSLLLGPLVGGMIIIWFILIRDYLLLLSYALMTGGSFDKLHLGVVWKYYIQYIALYFEFDKAARLTRVMAMLAFCVNFWLILFALGMLLVKMANTLFWGTKKVQWFIKRGQQHPLQAFGYVAAVIVFVGTIIVQTLGRPPIGGPG